MTAKIDEIGDGIFRLSVFVPEVAPPSGFTFNHFLLMDDEPLLFHCGKRKMFPLLADAVKKIMPIEKLRWATFGHFEADECGSMNEWLAAAPHCELMHGMTGVRTSLSDMADRPPRILANGETIEIGRKRVRYIDTPHVPHGWDAGVIFEETSKTLFVGDLFAHYGDPQPLTTNEIVSVAMKGNDSTYSTSLGPVTAPTIRKLAALNPQTLAVMHGSSFAGDGGAQLQGLADAYDERLRAAIAQGMILFDQQYAPGRSVRLDTLLGLRWLAILGQLAAVLIVQFAFDFEIEFPECLTVIGLYAALTIFVRLKFRGQRRIAAGQAALLLASDIAELALLLALTGGLQNPFAFLFLGPVLISATALPARMTMGLAGFAILCATALVFVHDPLPWPSDDAFELPVIYMIGIWLTIMLAIGYISIYAWQITEEGRQLADALAATELVLEREQHLSQLDGLAAAAAHELGTPLAIISVVSRELERALADSPHAEDVRILRDQAMRCREILGKLAERPTPDEPFEHMALSALIEDVVSPHRGSDIEIAVTRTGDGTPEPVGGRNPAILYGLGNLLENAVDFASKRVEVTANWTQARVSVSIKDDGPGFSPEILARLGEPYVRGPRPQRMPAASDEAGLGLGFFIAKTLLERSGARISMKNNPDSRGALVQLEWDRDTFERPYTPVPRPEPLSREG